MPHAPNRRDLARGIAIAGLLPVIGWRAVAQQPWPTKPIRLVVGAPPGGSLDQIARRVQPGLQQALGVSIVVDNKAGGSGAIAAVHVAQAAPDGHTLLVIFDTHSANPALVSNLPYDARKDFEPIMQIGWSPMMLAVHPGTPHRTFADFVAAARAAPGKLHYGTVGAGSLAHLAMTEIANALKLEWANVPYKGGGPMMIDATAGHIPSAISSLPSMGPHVKGGKMRALAVTSPKRHPEFPDVPAVAELGVPGFAANAWWGLVAPARTPPEIVHRVHKVFVDVLRDPGVTESLVTQGGIVYELSTPEAFGRFMEGEIARWAKVVKDNGIKPD